MSTGCREARLTLAKAENIGVNLQTGALEAGLVIHQRLGTGGGGTDLNSTGPQKWSERAGNDPRSSSLHHSNDSPIFLLFSCAHIEK